MSAPCVLATLRLHLATLLRADLGHTLIERFGSAEDVFRRRRKELAAVRGMTPRSLEQLTSADTARRAEAELRRTEREGISVLLFHSEPYPVPLRDLQHMPLVLFARGRPGAGDLPAVGVVGSRRPTPYGERQARRFAGRLAEWGIPVISGLARGIDGTAQEAALEHGGCTVAVLGSGLGRIYPPEHRGLADRIASGGRGGVLTEFPFETPPRSFHFPQRNRLISGLCGVLFVVEAGERSGSLITVDWALRQGKGVCVLPGRADQPQALGALRLLQDGATPVLGPEDLLAELGLRPEDTGTLGTRGQGGDRPDGSVSPLPGALGAALAGLFAEEDTWHPDDIAERLTVEPARLLAELSRLEIEGRLRRDAAGRYSLGG